MLLRRRPPINFHVGCVSPPTTTTLISLGLEHLDQLVRSRFQMARIRLDAGQAPGTRAASASTGCPSKSRAGSQAVLGEPVDQLLLLREAALDEASRGQRVERDDRPGERVARLERAAELLLPRVARAVAEDRVPAAEEDADDALAGLEAVLDVERLPRARLLVLGERERCTRAGCPASPCRSRPAPSRPAGSARAGRRRGRSSRWRGCTAPSRRCRSSCRSPCGSGR